MALGEAAEVDARAFAGEAQGARLAVENEVAVADGGAGTGQFFVARFDAEPVVVELPDAPA